MKNLFKKTGLLAMALIVGAGMVAGCGGDHSKTAAPTTS